MDEFALCWNNFQDNIASGFQNLYDRGDLVDVTLACEGKLLRAHKIVLAICSPYFQEMFTTNPCHHPIIVLKDVTVSVMAELLQFMYQGEVNVKHTELQSFMKIAETLQIKGLTTSNKQQQSNNAAKSLSSPHPGSNNQPSGSSSNIIDTKINSGSAAFSPSSSKSSETTPVQNLKRQNEYGTAEPYPIYPKKQSKKSIEDSETDMNSDSIDNMTSDEVFMPTIPQISMHESQRFDLANVKREHVESPSNNYRPGHSGAHPMHPGFIFDQANGSFSGVKNIEYPNDLNFPNEYAKGAGHMEIPAGTSITMLSSTSLLHGSCIFNRNNTVATQQGLKTYWLCKSYRITMCRARCITHQGRVISATGVHNHSPHMKGPHDFMQPYGNVKPQPHLPEESSQNNPPPPSNNNPTISHEKVEQIEQHHNPMATNHSPQTMCPQMVQHEVNQNQSQLHNMMQNVLHPSNLHVHHSYPPSSVAVISSPLIQHHHQQHQMQHPSHQNHPSLNHNPPHISPPTNSNSNSNSQSSRSSINQHPQPSPNMVHPHPNMQSHQLSNNDHHNLQRPPNIPPHNQNQMIPQPPMDTSQQSQQQSQQQVQTQPHPHPHPGNIVITSSNDSLQMKIEHI